MSLHFLNQLNFVPLVAKPSSQIKRLKDLSFHPVFEFEGQDTVDSHLDDLDKNLHDDSVYDGEACHPCLSKIDLTCFHIVVLLAKVRFTLESTDELPVKSDQGIGQGLMRDVFSVSILNLAEDWFTKPLVCDAQNADVVGLDLLSL